MAHPRTLFAYFEDGNLRDQAADLADVLRDFVAETTWQGKKPYVVSQAVAHPGARAGSAEWDLGLHLAVPGDGEDRWPDVERVVAFLLRLRRETGHDFVLGMYDFTGRYAEELAYVDREEPDLARLRARLVDGTLEE